MADLNATVDSGATLSATLTMATNGLSAYEVAVKNGYVGTEVQWLASLKGKDGVDGKDGAPIKLININTTITAASWSNGSYSISNESITANSFVYLSPAATMTKDMYEAMNAAEVIVIPAAGSVTLKALGTVPTIDIIADINLFNTWHITYSNSDITGIAQLDSSWQNYGDSLDFSTKKPWSDMKSIIIGDDNFVWIPKFYYRKYTPDSGKYSGKPCLEISPTKHDGFKIHPAFMYKGVEKNGFYIAAYKSSWRDGTNSDFVSVAGVMPANVVSIDQSISQASKKNVNGIDGYHLQTFYETSAINMLLMIEIGTTDAQGKIGQGDSSGGKLVNTGTTNAIYRGIYDYWGNGWEWVDGITSDSSGTIQIYDNMGNLTYVDTGVKIASGGNSLYIVSMYDNSGAGYDLNSVFLPKEFSQSAGKYGDKTYGDCAANMALIKGGGLFDDGDTCGPFSLEFDYKHGFIDYAVGGRMAKWDI